MALTGEGVDDEVLVELQVAGLRDAVIHEAFHELLEWHANFGGLAEFLEIDEAIHRTAERIGHDFDQDLPDHPGRRTRAPDPLVERLSASSASSWRRISERRATLPVAGPSADQQDRVAHRY